MKDFILRFKIVLAVVAAMMAVSIASCAITNINSGTSNSSFTGFLEGDKLDVSPEVGGQITSLAVDEGQTVAVGQPLAVIQDDLVQARIAIAQANVAAAEAQLALLQAGPRKEDLARAQAKVDQAQAGLAASTQALTDTVAIRSAPQMLQIGQAQAEARSKSAAEQVNATVAQAQAADEINKFWEAQTRILWDGVDIYLPNGANRLHFDTNVQRQVFAQQEWNKAGNAAWLAWAGVKQAQAGAAAADAALRDINDQVANPIALDTKVDQARANRDKAAAILESAQAALLILREGASPAQIQTAGAALDQARAARTTLDKDLGHYQIVAPKGGVVDRVYYRTGEAAAPGAPLVRLNVQGDLKLVIYVPMSLLGSVRLGDNIPIRVEGIENRSFSGSVTHINDTAEFSGRQNQTDSERNAQLVAVEISLKNADGQIKPGMPATVSFGK